MKQQSMDVIYVAQLARLKLSPEEVEQFQSQLGQILSHVEQLGTLNLEGVEATAHAVTRSNVFREDEILSSLSVEEALQNAPQRLNDLFKVPKVVE